MQRSSSSTSSAAAAAAAAAGYDMSYLWDSFVIRSIMLAPAKSWQ